MTRTPPKTLAVFAVPIVTTLILGLLTTWAWRAQTPLLGYFLSTCVGVLVYLLYSRMAMFRTMRDQALSEVQEREAAQRALREAETRYHGVFDSATDGLLVLDEAGRILEANPQTCYMSGYEAGGLTGRSMRELFRADRRGIGVLDDFLRQVKSFGAAGLEATITRGDGSALDVEIRGTTLKYDGAPRLLAILTDVTDLRHAVERHTLLSRKVLMTQEEERRRISRELHDELGQILTALHLEVDWIREESTSAPAKLQEAFGNAAKMVESAAEELRRICRGLRPPLLDDLGLEPAIRLLIEEEQGRTGLDVTVQLDEAEHAIAPDVALCVYRVLQESLNNIRRHASASSVNISLSCSDSELCLSVYDDGVGFEMGKKHEDRSGFGIAGMRERAFLIHGALDVRSEPYQGTRVTLRAPLGGAGKETSE
jgi:PAS domain S-box-containing protein